MVVETEAWTSQGHLSRVIQAASGGGGAEPRLPDCRAPAVPSLPSCTPQWGLHCSVLPGLWEALGTSAQETP